MAKIEVGGDLDKQYASVVTSFFFIIIANLMFFYVNYNAFL